MTPLARARHWLAARLIDAPRYRWALRSWLVHGDPASAPWVDLRNRHERLVRTAGQRGVACDWRWTSALLLPLERPALARRILARALQDWPLELADSPRWATGEPEVSFILGHRGRSRQAHLRTTLSALAAQRGIPVEVLVVEQDVEPSLASELPDWVRYLHTPPPRPDMAYSRSWAFNCGARQARGRTLVFHDNDVCPPRDYASELARLAAAGFDAARLQRFVFYLSAGSSRDLMAGRVGPLETTPAEVVQNCEGHSVAVDRRVYFELGGHDEAFVGWGGEDNEFFERLRTRRLHDHAYLPFLHLHHEPQPEKVARSVLPSPPALWATPPEARIAALRGAPIGDPRGPHVRELQ